MYESPINLYMQEIMSKMENERDNAITAKISESIGVDINKDELIKALQYDRQQYNEGYADAKAEYESMLSQIRAEISINAYPIVHGVNNHELGMTLYGILQVIDKYRKEEG